MDVWASLKANCASLSEYPRELWMIFVLKVLESYSYFSMSLIYVVFLTDSFGVSDLSAGGSYGLWGMLTVAWGVVFGPVIDYIGIRRSLLLCFAGEAVSRLLIATTSSKPFLYLILYTLLPASGSLGVPVMTIAVKRYAPAASRSIAYGLFYSVMNIALLAAGFIVDGLRALVCTNLGAPNLGAPNGSAGGALELMRDSNRLIIASGAVSSGAAFVMSLFLSRKVEAEALERERAEARGAWGGLSGDVAGGEGGEGGVVEGLVHASLLSQDEELANRIDGVDDPNLCSPRLQRRGCGPAALLRGAVAGLQRLNGSISEMLAYPGMWKYLVMALFLLNLRQTFRSALSCRYMDSMLPKYMQRFIGCSAPFGKVYAINPAMIIILVPLVTALTARIPHFDMVHYGSYVAASSMFWMYWIRNPPILASVVFVTQESLGEAVWSPRWYDYTMDIAPAGKEGLFGAIAAAPLFLAKLPTGLLSGYLLERFCPRVGDGCGAGSDACGGGGESAAAPMGAGLVGAVMGGEEGPCDPVMWAVVGAVTMMSPLLITSFAWWLRPGPGEGMRA